MDGTVTYRRCFTACISWRSKKYAHSILRSFQLSGFDEMLTHLRLNNRIHGKVSGTEAATTFPNPRSGLGHRVEEFHRLTQISSRPTSTSAFQKASQRPSAPPLTKLQDASILNLKAVLTSALSSRFLETTPLPSSRAPTLSRSSRGYLERKS